MARDLTVISKNHFFNNVSSLSLNAKFYSLVGTEFLSVYEIYKKIPDSNLTISLLCDFPMTQQKLNRTNQLKLWKRRKDLSGVTFRVGYIPCSLIFMNNEVK